MRANCSPGAGVRQLVRAILYGVGFHALSYAVATQAAEVADADNSSALAEIVVTAQKRSENVQNVPIAIVPLTAAQLEAGGVRNVQDLVAAVPGMFVSRDNAWGEIYIRGVGTNVISVGADPSVAEYVNGVYIARPNAALQEFSDIDRVEVLKGPQGTLYGRNATGGAISIWTQKPSDRLQANVDAIGGNFGTVRLRGSVSGPISDWLRVRASGIYSDNDGYQRNIFAAGRRQAGDKTRGGRLTFDLSKSEDFAAEVGFDYSKTDSTSVGDKVFGPASYAASKVTVPTDPFTVDINGCHCSTLEQYGVYGNLSWRFGDVTLKSISAYRENEMTIDLDVDRTSLEFIRLVTPEVSRTFSQELQISSDDNRSLTWIAGGYYFFEDGSKGSTITLSHPFANTPPPFGTLSSISTNVTNSYAMFAQGSYHFTDTVQLTLGGRYTKEDKTFKKVESDFLILPPRGATGYVIGPTTVDFKAFTPRAVLEFHPSSDVMLYASVSRGFKSGGFNSLGNQSQPSFRPEYLWSYTAGLKSEWFDRRLRANIEAYYYDYTDLQVNRNNGTTSIVENAASATVKGVDADLVALPVPGLQLELHAAYVDAVYDHFLTADPKRPADGVVDRIGNRLPRTPKFSATASMQYTHRLDNDAAVMGRLEAIHTSKVYFDSFNDPELIQKGFERFNARLSYRSSSDRWEVALFCNNLTDKTYYMNGNFGSNTGNSLSPAAPRTYGVQLSYHLK